VRFEHRYFGRTHAETGPVRSALFFAPDVSRPPTHFVGQVERRLPFREGMAALHAVVCSDLRPQTRDRSQYLEWRRRQDDVELADLMASVPARRAGIHDEIKQLRAELADNARRRTATRTPFYKARRQYFDWLWKHDRGAWYVLDPVITVHPDQIFFECFSQDESTYGRFGCRYDSFHSVGAFSCGTTNVDYSRALAAEFEKLRSYRDTELKVDPTGFEVQTDDDDLHREKKIDLPDTWVRGFVQVSAAMTMPGARLRLHPMDLHNLLFVLKRRKETHGPRSLRFRFSEQGQITVEVEPFGITLTLARSELRANKGVDGQPIREVRVWGRRRLEVLERLVPVSRHIDLTLMGTGMPSFWVVDLGGLDFTLGLSGWTANDWSRAGGFDLMAPRGEVDPAVSEAIYQALRDRWFAKAPALAQALGRDPAEVESALLQHAQAGRVVYDIGRKVYRARELFKDPLPLDQLRYASPVEAEARRLVDNDGLLGVQRQGRGDKLVLSGQVQDGRRLRHAQATVDADDRLVAGHCNCRFYQQNKLFKGPCAHILALRIGAAVQARAVAS